MSKAKYKDINGFLHLEGTPISRVQVAQYLGKQLDSRGRFRPKLLPEELYGVLRPAESLFDEETMRSFDGMPFRVGHQMLGKRDAEMNAKLRSVDDNPVDGCIFNVRRDKDKPDYLVADIVIYTDKALQAIANGTKELSLGYRCVYEPVDTYPEPKVFRGEPYYFTQKDIKANHLALVPRGRAGSSVCVQDAAVEVVDGLVVTCDSLPEEIEIMNKNEKKAQEQLADLLRGTEEQIQDVLDYCSFTEEQKAKVKELKNGKTEVENKEKVEVEDAKVPPEPPPVAEKPAEEKPAEPVEPPAKPTEPPAEPPAKPTEPPAKPTEPPAEPPAEPVKPVEPPAKPAEPTQDGCDKRYTEDELKCACDEARKEGRKDGIRAVYLAQAVGEDVGERSEAEIARDACKKIKGLEFAADASDDVAIAAIRGHLANKKGKGKEGEEPAKPAPKKTLLSVPTQDEAIAKTHGSFNAGSFNAFLATH